MANQHTKRKEREAAAAAKHATKAYQWVQRAVFEYTKHKQEKSNANQR